MKKSRYTEKSKFGGLDASAPPFTPALRESPLPNQPFARIERSAPAPPVVKIGRGVSLCPLRRRTAL